MAAHWRASITGPIAAIGGGLAALAINAANTGDQIKASAEAAGIGAQAYQEIGYALGQVANLTSEQVDKVLKNLTTTIGEAAGGSKKATEALLEFASPRTKSQPARSPPKRRSVG